MILSPDSESLREYNSCHSPAGSPKGGQFCAKDDGPTVALHRGDSKDVEPSLSHADPRALFGAGIYLTDSKRIAGDYTVKGSDPVFRYDGGKPGQTSKEDVRRTFIRQLAQGYEDDGSPIPLGMKALDYYTHYEPTKGYSPDPLNPGKYVIDRTARRLNAALAAYNTKYADHEIRVNADGTAVIQPKAAKGRVATYSVPKSWLSKTIDAEAEIDEDVADAIIDTLRAHDDRSTARDVAAFVNQWREDGSRPTFRDVFTAISGGPLRDDEGAAVDLRRAFKALGYKGIRYAGGITIGGAGHHEAYVFWDEQGLRKRRARGAGLREVALVEFNPCHSPEDGRFCSAPESGRSGGGSPVPPPEEGETASRRLRWYSDEGHHVEAVLKAFNQRFEKHALPWADVYTWWEGKEGFAFEDTGDKYGEAKDIYDYVQSVPESSLEDLYPQAPYWEEHDGTLYHATPESNAASIEKHGLSPENKTRGITNRSVGAAVFASTDPEAISSYGPVVFQIDLGAMKRDKYTPEVSFESDHREAELRSVLASKLGIEDWYDGAGWDGTQPTDRIIHGHVPAKYLRRMN